MINANIQKALASIGAWIIVAAPSPAVSDAKVIANVSVTVSQVSSGELKGVLLVTRTSLADGAHVEPVLLRSGGVHEAFVKALTGKTVAGLDNYYRSLVFTGKGAMPKMLASDEEMVAYVKATRGAMREAA